MKVIIFGLVFVNITIVAGVVGLFKSDLGGMDFALCAVAIASMAGVANFSLIKQLRAA